jgi:hypothetical protein
VCSLHPLCYMTKADVFIEILIAFHLAFISLSEIYQRANNILKLNITQQNLRQSIFDSGKTKCTTWRYTQSLITTLKLYSKVRSWIIPSMW